MNVIRPPQPVLDTRGEPHMRRFQEQRWLLDNIIRANGIDWDQPRSLYLNGPCGSRGQRRFRRHPRAGEEDGRHRPGLRGRRAPARSQGARPPRMPVTTITARDNYFMAAVHWGAAQWPYDENDETNIACNNKKRDCYAEYARARRSPRRGGVGPVQGQGDARPGFICRRATRAAACRW